MEEIKQELTEKEKYLEILKESIGFKYNPPTIDEFLDDPFYLGDHKVIPPIYPFWRKVLRELYPDNITTKSSTLVFTGSIGGGKSTISAVITLYDICKMCCLREPLKFFNLGSLMGWKIKCFHVYKYRIQGLVDVLNEAIRGGSVPFFERELRSGTSIVNKISIEAVAKLKDLISDDVPIFHLSELNFCKPELAKDVINSSFSRLSSRFIKGENLFTHIIMDSSTTGPDSPVETFLREDPKSETAMVVRVNAWNTKEGLGLFFNYGSFEVYAGDSQTNPFIVPEGFSDEQRKKYDVDRFITVPNELRSEFERDIVLALQEKAGMSTASTSKFFTNKLKLDEAFCLQKHHDDVIRVDFFDPRDTVMKYLRDDVAELPKDRRLYIKVDCAFAHDNFGLAVAYADGTRVQTIDGLRSERMLIKVPICVAINRYDGQETAINKVEDFILELAKDREVALVLTDFFESSQIKQPCLQNGIEAELQSVDRTDIPYLIFKNAVYSGLVQIADNQLTYKEALELERVSPVKIDHPATGCFVGDTKVETANGPKNICDITTEDLVWSFNEDTKEFEIKKVLSSRMTKMESDLTVVNFNQGKSVECTHDHRFMTIVDGKIFWKEAKDLKAGDVLVSCDDVKVSSIGRKLCFAPVPVYDIEVEDNHNFVLSGANCVVHNSKDTIDAAAGVVARMIELGPEEVLAPPSAILSEQINNAYASMADAREKNRVRRTASVSDYLAF